MTDETKPADVEAIRQRDEEYDEGDGYTVLADLSTDNARWLARQADAIAKDRHTLLTLLAARDAEIAALKVELARARDEVEQNTGYYEGQISERDNQLTLAHAGAAALLRALLTPGTSQRGGMWNVGMAERSGSVLGGSVDAPDGPPPVRLEHSMSTETRYWECTECRSVHEYNTPNPTWCEICDVQDVEMEPVAVVPQAEYDQLKRLEASVDDDALWKLVAGEAGAAGVSMPWHAMQHARAALRRAAKGET